MEMDLFILTFVLALSLSVRFSCSFTFTTCPSPHCPFRFRVVGRLWDSIGQDIDSLEDLSSLSDFAAGESLPTDIKSNRTIISEMQNETLPSASSVERFQGNLLENDIARRSLIIVGAALIGGTFFGSYEMNDKPSGSRQGFSLFPKGNIVSPNLTQVVLETKINITMECTTSPTCISLDTTTFQKKQNLRLPGWLPPYLVPPSKVIRNITNTELLLAAVVAGSTMEITRTSLLYPISTLKTRVQTDVNTRESIRRRQLSIRRRIRILQLNAVRHYREGNLFAGITPTLLVTVPATGIYCGVRDVVRRRLNTLDVNDISVAVGAAFFADVVALAVRTPADTLAIRLQSATGAEAKNHSIESEEELQEAVDAQVGSWFSDGIERLPTVILTDLPYLLSRIALNRVLIHGPLDIGRYELLSISTALLCGFLTTPFDVARTRILVDSDNDPTNGIDGGLLRTGDAGLVSTFKKIMNEGNGGVSNLFAGWFERIVYLGIGRAWLEPLQIVGYIALRDTILLEWFD